LTISKFPVLTTKQHLSKYLPIHL